MIESCHLSITRQNPDIFLNSMLKSCPSILTVNYIENSTLSNRGYEEIMVLLNYLRNTSHVLRNLNMHHFDRMLTTRVAQATV